MCWTKSFLIFALCSEQVTRLGVWSTVAQMAEQATRDQKVPVSIPAWIQWDFASKYKADLFRRIMADDQDVWYGYMQTSTSCILLAGFVFQLVTFFTFLVLSPNLRFALDSWVQKRVCWPLCYTASPVEQ